MPAEVNPKCFHQSASSIASFKACPQRFRLAYREGLRPATDTDSQRMGTNWHAMHETYANTFGDRFGQYTTHGAEDEAAVLEESKAFALEAVIDHLNNRYSEVPPTKTPQEWALERQILLTSFIGYLWYWQNDPVEFLHSELAFELPVLVPKVNLPLPASEVLRVGKIDHLIRWQGAVCALERKSTSRAIAPDSDYWDKSKKDTQVSMYALAIRDMLKDHETMDGEKCKRIDLPSGERLVVKGERFGNTLYDVWHKPTIKPKVLTQAETKAFIETGTYCDQQFTAGVHHPDESNPDHTAVLVDGEQVEVEPGKKGFAIRESVGMYGARLLSDIYERPDFYFARREIARTDADLNKFRIDSYNIYQTQKTMDKTGHWYENESQCRATYACSYIPICYGPGADAVCDGETTPGGFKRIFVDLKVNGETLED